MWASNNRFLFVDRLRNESITIAEERCVVMGENGRKKIGLLPLRVIVYHKTSVKFFPISSCGDLSITVN